MTAVFIHIPRTGGVSVQAALELEQHRNRRTLVPGAEYGDLMTFGHVKPSWLVRQGHIKPNDFLFSFVRNPYDRAVSLWAYWLRERAGRPQWGFLEWCRHLPELNWRVRSPQARWLEGVPMGFLGRFERLQYDFDHLCDVLAIDRRPLPHLNRSERESCAAYYCDESRDIIRKHYREDFESFGYDDRNLPD